MVDRAGEDSGDGGSPDEGKILSPHELDISDSEYVEEIDEGRFVISPETRTDQSKSKPGARGSGKSQPDGRLAGGAEEHSSQPTSKGPTPSQRGTGKRPQTEPSDGPRRAGATDSAASPQLDEEIVRRWLRQRYKRSNSKYAFDVTAQFEGRVSQRQLASNDLITVFESLMLWYAQQVDSTMPVEEVLGILLNESNVPVRYPPESVKNLVKSTDLGPDDTIADLLEAVQDEDGVQL